MMIFRMNHHTSLEYDDIQDEPPHKPGDFHHAAVAEELLEVWPQGSRGRGIRCAEVGKQNADFRLEGVVKFYGGFH
jgi:hypothetical protein